MDWMASSNTEPGDILRAFFISKISYMNFLSLGFPKGRHTYVYMNIVDLSHIRIVATSAVEANSELCMRGLIPEHYSLINVLPEHEFLLSKNKYL